MAKENEQEELRYGGRSAREVWEDSYDKRPDIVRHYSDKGKLMQTDYLTDDTGDYYDAEFNRNPTTMAAKQWEKDKEWAQVSGNWIGNANEHAAKLYNEDNMDLNDMKKYAALAGVTDINSENDVAGIRQAYNDAHTSEDEMQSAISSMRDELTESVENGGDQTAAEQMSFNDYLENADAQTSDGAEGAAEGAQAMLSDNVKAIAADKQAMGRSKTNMGKYVLSNLKSDTYGGAE